MWDKIQKYRHELYVAALVVIFFWLIVLSM